MCESQSKDYSDTALTTVNDEDTATLDLLTRTAGALEAVAHVRKVAELTMAPRPAA
jgi:hypothetical protein